MAYGTGNMTSAQPAVDLMVAYDTTILAAGYTFVEQWVSSTIVANVYKSPAASNSFGQDWYLATYRTATTSSVSLTVFESWDATNKRAIRYVPSTSNLTPAATTYAVNDASGLLLSGAITRPSVGVNTSTIYYWYIHANMDRVVAGSSVSNAVYAGLADSVIPGDPFPLVVLTTQSSTSSQTTLGGVTREPFQTSATTYNFFVQLYGAAGNSASSTSIYGLSEAGTPPAGNSLYTGFPVLSRCAIHSGRLLNSTGWRFVLKDFYIGAGGTAAGDTMTFTIGATTYTYVRPHQSAWSLAHSFFMPTT